MTEAEWLTSCSPRSLLLSLGENATLRKQVLFAAASWRLIWNHAIPEEREEINVWERYADGLATAEEVIAAREAYGGEGNGTSPDWNPPWWAIMIAEDAAEQGAHAAEQEASAIWAKLTDIEQEERWFAVQADLERQQSILLRDIFNPFHPMVFTSACQTPEVITLAHAIYKERTFDRLPILADALERAGCHDLEILLHCRQEKHHVRGCWVVDLILGKE